MSATPKVKPKPSAGSDRRSLRLDPIVQVNKRNRELEQRTQRTLLAVLLLTVALMVSVTGNVIQGLRQPDPRYFAQNEATGALTPIVPLNKPISSKNSILQHASDAIMELYALDFMNYRGQLQRASGYFTARGWEKYINELEASSNLKALTERRMVLTGVVTKPPVIVRQGEAFGTLFWEVEVPYQVRYLAAGFDQTQDLVATIKIVRVDATENPRGVAITQFVATQVSASSGG